MPHYFFDLRDGSDFVRDEEGCWFPDFAAAEREAAETAASMLLDARRSDNNPTKFTIEVRDENDRCVMDASVALHIGRRLESAAGDAK
jgi:hypothetical protein